MTAAVIIALALAAALFVVGVRRLTRHASVGITIRRDKVRHEICSCGAERRCGASADRWSPLFGKHSNY